MVETARQAEVILVEDNPLDAEMVQRAFRKSCPGVHLLWLKDGEEAQRHFVEVQGGPRTACLVILDLKLPFLDGFEVLKQIKRSPASVDLPVVVLSSSCEPNDIDRAYRLGANSFVVKPMDFGGYAETLGLVGRYWTRCNRLLRPCQAP